jgi:hypothetical protein
VLAKSLGTTNPINMAKATVDALKRLRRPEDVARIRGKQISEVLPISLARADAPAVGYEAPEANAETEAEQAPAPEESAAVIVVADSAPDDAVEEEPSLPGKVAGAAGDVAGTVAKAAVDVASDVIESVSEKGVVETVKEGVEKAKDVGESVSEKGVVETVKEGVEKAKDVVTPDEGESE